MKRSVLRYCAVVVSCVSLAGCATAPPSAPSAKPVPVERATDAKPYDFRSEGKIPPTTDVPNEPDIEEIGISESAIDVTDAEAPPDTARQAAPEDTLIDGFRAQVFATADREIAENAARVATERLKLPSYVELDGGVYKVRVGDFATRPEADDALVAIRRQYTDAWVVPAKIRARRGP
jgi:SPOR domain